MIYTIDITTPKDTLITSPKKSILKVTKGLVYKVEVDFPPGPCGFLYVAIFDGSYRVWPSTPGAWFHSDALVISYDDPYMKETQPYEFEVQTYNIDDTYEHWCQVRLGVVSKAAFIARFLPTYTEEETARVFAEMVTEQELLKLRAGL